VQCRDPGRVTAAKAAVLITGNEPRGTVACHFEPRSGEGMKTVVTMVGKVSLLGKRKEKQILLKKNKQTRKWAEAFKINSIFL